jgi:multiphosphoryl transfer protein
VQQLLERPGGQAAALIDPELVVTESESRTKAEVLKEIADRLYVASRTEHPREVEEAAWKREAACPTGIGCELAVPHCITDALRTDSLVVVRLKSPVEWGSLDDRPVRMLVFLAIRESDQAPRQMKILSMLARHLMHQEFRDRLLAESDPQLLCRFLQDTLDGHTLPGQ